MWNLIRTKVNTLYSWYKRGRFWRQVKIKLFSDYGWSKLYNPIAAKQSVNPKKIVCVSYHGVYHSDSPAFILDEMLKRDPELDVVWLVDPKGGTVQNADPRIRLVDLYSYKALYELATAKLWIDNSRKNVFVPKKDNQFYIQTWHGGIALKTVEADAQQYLSKRYLKWAKIDARNTDLMISNSKFCSDMYRRAFWYDGVILEEGLPRNDFLINHADFNEDQLKQNLGIPKENKILLYAPTFRGDKTKNPYIQDFSKIAEFLEKKTGAPVTILVKHHPNIRQMAVGFQYIGNVLDVTSYPDIQHLYIISDYMITDYSSTMFEFAMLDKPVFLYLPDWKDYQETERKFYFSFEELPFLSAYSIDELLSGIFEFETAAYHASLELFFKKIGLCESGDATGKIATYLLDAMKS